MEKDLEQWNEIADLINMDKKRALADFQRHDFAPGAMPGGRTEPRRRWSPVMQPVPLAAAASLLLMAGLILFWTLHGSWRSVSTVPAAEQLLAASFLYSQAGIADRETSPSPSLPDVNPFFPSWVEAEFAADMIDVPAQPSSSIEYGDPLEVRRRIKRAIAENVFEQLLLTLQEFHNKEV